MKMKGIEGLSLAIDVLDLVEYELGEWLAKHGRGGLRTGKVSKSHSDIVKAKKLIRLARIDWRKEKGEGFKETELLDCLWGLYGSNLFLCSTACDDLDCGDTGSAMVMDLLIRLSVSGEVVSGYGVNRTAAGLYRLRKVGCDENG